MPTGTRSHRDVRHRALQKVEAMTITFLSFIASHLPMYSQLLFMPMFHDLLHDSGFIKSMLNYKRCSQDSGDSRVGFNPLRTGTARGGPPVVGKVLSGSFSSINSYKGSTLRWD